MRHEENNSAHDDCPYRINHLDPNSIELEVIEYEFRRKQIKSLIHLPLHSCPPRFLQEVSGCGENDVKPWNDDWTRNVTDIGRRRGMIHGVLLKDRVPSEHVEPKVPDYRKGDGIWILSGADHTPDHIDAVHLASQLLISVRINDVCWVADCKSSTSSGKFFGTRLDSSSPDKRPKGIQLPAKVIVWREGDMENAELKNMYPDQFARFRLLEREAKVREANFKSEMQTIVMNEVAKCFPSVLSLEGGVPTRNSKSPRCIEIRKKDAANKRVGRTTFSTGCGKPDTEHRHGRMAEEVLVRNNEVCPGRTLSRELLPPPDEEHQRPRRSSSLKRHHDALLDEASIPRWRSSPTNDSGPCSSGIPSRKSSLAASYKSVESEVEDAMPEDTRDLGSHMGDVSDSIQDISIFKSSTYPGAPVSLGGHGSSDTLQAYRDPGSSFTFCSQDQHQYLSPAHPGSLVPPQIPSSALSGQEAPVPDEYTFSPDSFFPLPAGNSVNLGLDPGTMDNVFSLPVPHRPLPLAHDQTENTLDVIPNFNNAPPTAGPRYQQPCYGQENPIMDDGNLPLATGTFSDPNHEATPCQDWRPEETIPGHDAQYLSDESWITHDFSWSALPYNS